MLRSIASSVADIVLGRVALSLGLLLVVVPVALGLSYGTEALMALGMSRDTAGTVTTLAVVAAGVYGLYLFATRAIDW
ncbi:MAG: hypothetical protein ACLFR5_02535 [Halobacteriales archaeon]